MMKNIAVGAAKNIASLKSIPATPGIALERLAPENIRTHASTKSKNMRASEL